MSFAFQDLPQSVRELFNELAGEEIPSHATTDFGIIDNLEDPDVKIQYRNGTVSRRRVVAHRDEFGVVTEWISTPIKGFSQVTVYVTIDPGMKAWVWQQK